MAVFDKMAKTSVIYLAALPVTSIHQNREAQIIALIAKEIPTKKLAKYLNYTNVFLPDWAIKLPKHTEINDYNLNFVKKSNHLMAKSIARL